jgi:hypothetical protein
LILQISGRLETGEECPECGRRWSSWGNGVGNRAFAFLGKTIHLIY